MVQPDVSGVNNNSNSDAQQAAADAGIRYWISDTSRQEGRNPFADKRVRQAMNMTIDRDAIKKVVMRGQSVPAGIVAPPFVNVRPSRVSTVQ